MTFPLTEALLEAAKHHDMLVASGCSEPTCARDALRVSAAACEAIPEIEKLLAQLKAAQALAGSWEPPMIHDASVYGDVRRAERKKCADLLRAIFASPSHQEGEP